MVYQRLVNQGQFDGERWSPLLSAADENFEAVWNLIGTGLKNTLIAACIAIILSLLIGTVVGTARVMAGRAGRVPLIGIIELLRGLPVIVLIYMAYQLLPDLGVDYGPLPGDDALWWLVTGLVAYNSVIFAEILRSGVASLPRGQREAGLVIGLTPLQTMRLIQLPQAFRTMLPAVISQMVVVLKDTSLAAFIGQYPELLNRGRTIQQNLDNPLQTYLLIGLIFISVNFALSQAAMYVERRISKRSASVGRARAVQQ
ncbi:amino acid ABC transporter permease [Kineosporia sp. J2-2]|uniref:Amino acid ABC transporter permease n=1 Tax=Kineosporia corallincola TaxID=2835133 RepID=A0ABS5TSR5_9ACTN|nr:amino acid ABC transporter permease [Kineosporia corallincola]MBT0773862.1 amino acid ABC transporter permease [Kineosporia corallincola]